MGILIDYISWPMECVYRAEFDNCLFESLEPSSNEYFIRRMSNDFPDFENYLIRDTPIAIGSIVVFEHILKTHTIKELEDRANAYSYTVDYRPSNHLIIFKPTHSPTVLPRDSYYIHISPVDLLDMYGIRCKASGRFEPYEPRIYLFPLYSMVDSGKPRDEQYDMLISACTRHANRFNEVYMERGLIQKPETYNVYLVELPEGYPIYDDYSMEEPSVYVENSIPPANVRKVGSIEPPGSKPKYVKRIH